MNLKQQILRRKNTKKEGMLEFLLYCDKNSYVAVCLTLNIVEEGKNPKKLIESVTEAAKGHVMLVIKKNLSDELLNRPAPTKYWNKYFNALEKLKKSKIEKSQKSPFRVFTTQMPMSLATC